MITRWISDVDPTLDFWRWSNFQIQPKSDVDPTSGSDVDPTLIQRQCAHWVHSSSFYGLRKFSLWGSPADGGGQRETLRVNKLYWSVMTFYNSLIKPHFTYCISCWGNTSKTNLNKLYILQKKISRILTKSDYLAHSQPLFEKIGMMTIYELLNYFVGIFVYKSIHTLP